jgi:hypothetical protein
MEHWGNCGEIGPHGGTNDILAFMGGRGVDLTGTAVAAMGWESLFTGLLVHKGTNGCGVAANWKGRPGWNIHRSTLVLAVGL